MRKLDYGVIATLLLAIIGFAFWCGEINSLVRKLDLDAIQTVVVARLRPEIEALAVPRGTVVAWAPGGQAGIPKGWAVCNGDSGWPDLRKRFVMGVADSADAGKMGGRDRYSFDIPRTEETLQAGGSRVPRPDRFSTTEEEVLPPFYTLVFLVKL